MFVCWAGGKRGHKGGRKQFTNPEQLKADIAKEKKEKEWRKQHGEEEDSSEEESGDEQEVKGAAGGARKKTGGRGEYINNH